MIKGIGIAIRGLGKALKKDPSTPISSVKPEIGLKKTKEFLNKIKSKQVKPE
jgi:hypothetical protein